MDEEEEKMEEESEEKEEEVIAELDGNNVFIKEDQANLIHERGYYGQLQEDGSLKLDPVEALLLSERKRIKIFDKMGQEYDFAKIVKKFVDNFPELWVKYLCYKDLRSRGYIVKAGYGTNIDYRVYDRGAQIGTDAAQYLVHTVVEGSPLKLISLDKITKVAKSNRKKLVLAVVDRVGEVTFYKAQEVDL
ncbi:MAG: tRNA-intron lyase [Candidatus Helarchaeota archaeon]|nr:tRNA-intron lyase [Candidatus Helarchaeota archaeon]